MPEIVDKIPEGAKNVEERGCVQKIPKSFPGVRFKNKKHTLGRLKWSQNLNNWNNRTDICARGIMSPERYAIYRSRSHSYAKK